MKIVCLSASNTKSKGTEGTSTKLCTYMKETIEQNYTDNFTAETVALSEFDLKSCNLCGACMKTGRCAHDEDFNRLISKLSEADGMLFVIPHYSPIPSKLLILFEKINEIIYSGWLNNPEYVSQLSNKPVGLIGHGGMVENPDSLRYYHDRLLKPVADTLRSLSFRIVKYDNTYENGVVFGLKDDTCIRMTDNNIFPDIVQDWPMIKTRIRPFISRVIEEINS